MPGPIRLRVRIPAIDMGLGAAVIALVVIGLLTVYSATSVPGAHEGLWIKQLQWAGLAAVAAWAAAAVPYRVYEALAWPFYGVSLLLLVAALLAAARPRPLTLILLVALNGAVSWSVPHIWAHLHDYQRRRIETFLDPSRDPYGAGYQIIQSKIAIGSGGVLGKGYLKGSQKALSYLPMRHTDFIYSVVGEEVGLIGSLTV